MAGDLDSLLDPATVHAVFKAYDVRGLVPTRSTRRWPAPRVARTPR